MENNMHDDDWCVRKCCVSGRNEKNVMMAMILRFTGALSDVSLEGSHRNRVCVCVSSHLFRLNVKKNFDGPCFISLVHFSRIRLLHHHRQKKRNFLCIKSKSAVKIPNSSILWQISISRWPTRELSSSLRWRVHIAMCRQWFPLINSWSTFFFARSWWKQVLGDNIIFSLDQSDEGKKEFTFYSIVLRKGSDQNVKIASLCGEKESEKSDAFFFVVSLRCRNRWNHSDDGAKSIGSLFCW